MATAEQYHEMALHHSGVSVLKADMRICFLYSQKVRTFSGWSVGLFGFVCFSESSMSVMQLVEEAKLAERIKA